MSQLPSDRSVRKRWIILTGLVVVASAVISQFPLSAIGPKLSIGGKTPVYSGTIWKGYMSGTDAGVLNLETSLGRLFTGKNPVHVWGGPDGLLVKAEAGPAGLRAIKLEGTMKALALKDPRIGAVNGDFRLDVPDMKLMQDCEYANGTAWTDFLSRNKSTLYWEGPVLEGPVRCENGQIIMDLSGKDQSAEITAKVTIGLEGSYRADITTKVNRTLERFAEPSLKQFGFYKEGGLYKLTEQGKWQ